MLNMALSFRVERYIALKPIFRYKRNMDIMRSNNQQQIQERFKESLKFLIQQTNNRLDHDIHALRMSLQEAHILVLLQTKRQTSVSKAALELDQTTTQVKRLIARLVRKNLVEKK